MQVDKDVSDWEMLNLFCPKSILDSEMVWLLFCMYAICEGGVRKAGTVLWFPNIYIQGVQQNSSHVKLMLAVRKG